MLGLHRLPLTALALLVSAGCFTEEVHVAVHVDPPFAVEGRAFPYDPMALFDSLPAGFAPRPEYPDLETAIRSFEMPRTAQLDTLSQEWAATRDSVEEAAGRLFAMDRNSAAYREEYGEFRVLYARLTARARLRNRLLRQLMGPQTESAARVQAAADTVRLWEDSAFALVAETVGRLTAAREVTTFMLDELGSGTVTLAPGDWWISARGRHPTNPFLEYFWNQPIRISGLRRSYRVPLSSRTAIIRWRY